MDKKWMPKTAGVLDILYGVGEAVAGSFALTSAMQQFIVPGIDWRKISFALVIAVGVLVIVGGICALKRKMWWLALVGSIFALIPPALYIWICWPLFKLSYLLHAPLLEILAILLLGFIGILAIFPIVLMVLSRKQFEGRWVG